MSYDGFPTEETVSAPPTGLADYGKPAEGQEQEQEPEPAEAGDDFEISDQEPTDELPREATQQEQEGQETPEAEPGRRYQQRVRQLNETSKVLREENKRLIETLEAIKRSTQVTEQHFQQQQEMHRQQQQAVQPELRRREMIAAGLNPAVAEHQIIFDQYHSQNVLKAEMAEMREALQRVSDKEAYSGFRGCLEQTLSSELRNYDVPKEMLTEIMETAEEILAARGLSASEAAKKAA